MEANRKNSELEQRRDKFKLDPPEDAWSQLNAALDKEQADMYRQKSNRFKWLSITLALLLISCISYYYFIHQEHTNTKQTLVNQNTIPLKSNSHSVDNKSLPTTIMQAGN